MEDHTVTKSKTKQVSEKLLYIATAISIPNIFLFYLYNNNVDENNIRLSHTYILALFFAVVSVCVFLLFYWLVQNKGGALVALTLLWAAFWLFESLYSAAVAYISYRRELLVYLAGGIAGLVFFFRWYKPKILTNRFAANTFAVIVCILFVYNLVPGLYNHIVELRGVSRGHTLYELKRNFTIDDSLPSPDIYWFHLDGMLGFDAVEKYFGEDQESLKNELTSRGFLLNEDARLKASCTQLALPALTSPGFYDSYFGDILAEATDNALRPKVRSSVNKRLREDGVRYNEDILPNPELFYAFIDAGYRQATFAISGFFPFADRIYLNARTAALAGEVFKARLDTLSAITDLEQLLISTTPLSIVGEQLTSFIERRNKALWEPIPKYSEQLSQLRKRPYISFIESQLYKYLIDSFNIQSPKLIYAVNSLAKSPYNKIAKSEGSNYPLPDNPDAVDLLYFEQHEYATEVMLTAIDMVLEINPDAIIILQADHGVHTHTTLAYLEDVGYSLDEMMDFNYSTFSAVRIPPQYGVLSEPLDPLDIARYLVNHFVGWNYEMLFYSGE